jgi:hypothetical protein
MTSATGYQVERCLDTVGVSHHFKRTLIFFENLLASSARPAYFNEIISKDLAASAAPL